MKSKMTANADATAGQLRLLVLEMSATFHPFPRDAARKPTMYYPLERQRMRAEARSGQVAITMAMSGVKSQGPSSSECLSERQI